uniref:EGF-like domain-containing protein n=1 Tax=Ditylenchus dipsaci TaxID=166011 RepID=A0A915E9I2_9BILA
MTLVAAVLVYFSALCCGFPQISLLNHGALIPINKRKTSFQLLTCDFACINGKCNPITRSCVCNEGWSGGACDVCSIGKICDWSISRPAISIILPQTGPVASTTSEHGSSSHTGFVFAHGRGFPRGKDARYNCLFGGVATEGQWLSNSVVRCTQPPRAHVGKHAFNLVPLGTNAYIPYEVETMHHYTFFMNCDASSCQGSCLGPLCLCRLHSQTGQRCEISNLETETNSTVIENDPAITHAQELQPYIAKIPVQSPSSHLTILYTDIDQLTIDPFENTVEWDQPIGNNKPYHISIQAVSANSVNVLNWTLTVEPSYIPVVDNVTFSNDSVTNNRIVYGVIQSRNHSSSNKSIDTMTKKVPITLKVYLDSSTNLVETVQTFSTTDEQHILKYELYPYIDVPGRYSITAQHPHTDSADNSFVEWIEDEFKIEAQQLEIVINEKNFTESYRIFAKSKVLCVENTAEWMVEVLEPRKFISIASFSQSIDHLHLDVTFSITNLASKSIKPNTILQLAFNCDFQTAITTQTLHSSKPTASVVNLNPERIFVSTVSSRNEHSSPPQPTLSIDVQLEYLEEDTKISLSDADLSPFRLVWGDLHKIQQVGTPVKLWLQLESDWDDSFSADSQINIPNSQNPVFSIPYKIRREVADTIAFVLTIKCYTDLAGDNPNSLVDVELFSTNKEQYFSKSVHLNGGSHIILPLKTDFFQLKVKSTEYLPFTTVIKITTDNSTLIVGLDRQPAQYFVSDGKEIYAENSQAQTKSSAPHLSIRPSIFPIAEYAEDVYVNVVHQNGPLNSFLLIKKVETDQPYLLILNNNSTIPALCTGCGYRLPIRILQNPNPESQNSNCNTYAIPIPFTYTIPGLPQTFRSSTFAVIDARADSSTSKPFMCSSDFELAQKTSLVIDCATAKLRECRKLYFSQPTSTPMCDSQWSNIPDDLLSIHTYAQYLLLAAKCQMFGVDFGLVKQMIRCISTMDFDCPINEPNVDKSTALIDPGLFAGQLFNQHFGLVQPLKIGVQSMFPALSAVDSQLANFPAVMHDFLEQLEKVFPSSDLNNALGNKRNVWFDAFLKAASDQSRGGALVTQEELEDFEDLSIWVFFLDLTIWLLGYYYWLKPTVQDSRDNDKESVSRYRCDHHKWVNKAYNCKAKMRVRRPADSDKVIIEKSGRCNHGKVKERKLDSPVKEKLKEYDEQEGPKKSPSVIRRQLRKDLNRPKAELPTTTQIASFNYLNKVSCCFERCCKTLRATNWDKGAGLISRWNETLEDLQGSDINLQFPELKARIGDFRDLVSRADRLKSITRQFGGANPFSMLHDILKKMFANIKNNEKEESIGSAIVKIQPAEISEGEEFRIFVSVQNKLKKESLKNIHLNVDFGKEFFGANRNGLKYRVGPVFYSGIASIDSANQLETNAMLTAEWTVVPVPDYRLTKTVTQTPQIVLSFDVGSQRKNQRLRSPVFNILPRASVRVLAFAFPTVHRENWQQGDEEESSIRPFTLSIAVINSGYSDLNKAEIVEIQPWLVVARNRSSLITADYKFTNVKLDGSDLSDNSGHLNIGSVASSQSRHLTLNISTVKEKEAIFRNLSLLMLANDQVLTQFDYRFFLIHDTTDAGHTSFLVSESSQPFPLHYYSKQTGQLVPLQSLQPIEEKQTTQQINGFSYVSILVAYRRLAMDIANAPASATSAVFGTFHVNPLPETKKGKIFELVRASEVLARNGVQQRVLLQDKIWMQKKANTTIVKFVDLEAVGQTSSSQIIYEFLFGDPEHFKLPYFSQSLYRIQVVPGRFYSESPKGDPIVISSLKAVSHIGAKFNYSLVSKRPDSHFEVVPQTGEIVLTDPLNKTIEPEALCMNLIAEDSHNHKTVVPVQLSSSIQKRSDQEECGIFPSTQEDPLYYHVFNGDTDSLVRNPAVTIVVPVSEPTSTTSITTTALSIMPSDSTLPLVATTIGPRFSLATREMPRIPTILPVFTVGPVARTIGLESTSSSTTTARSTTPFTTSTLFIPEAEEEEQEHGSLNALTISSSSTPPATLAIKPDQSLPAVSITSSIATTTTTRSPTFAVITTNPLAILPWLWTPKPMLTVQPAATQTLTTPNTLKMASTNSVTPQQMPSLRVSTHVVEPLTVSTVSETSSQPSGASTITTQVNVPLTEDGGSSEDMVKMACRQRQLEPIWAVICDLGKTVYKTRD